MLTIAIPTIGKTSKNTIVLALQSAIRFSRAIEPITSTIIVVDNSQDEAFGQWLTNAINHDHYPIEIKQVPNRLDINENWNYALSLCRSKWLVYLHDDDELTNVPTDLRTLLSSAVGFISSRSIYTYHEIGRSITVDSKSGTEDVILDCPKFCSTIINAGHLRNIGGFDPGALLFSDYLCFIQLSIQYGCLAGDTIMGKYNIHANNTMDKCRERLYGEAVPYLIRRAWETMEDPALRYLLLRRVGYFVYGKQSLRQRALEKVDSILIGNRSSVKNQ